MSVTFTPNPHWIDKKLSIEDFTDKDLLRIIVFFLFHAPCEGQSAMGRTIEEYNWSAPWKKPYWLNRHLKKAASDFNILYSATSYDTLVTAFTKANLLTNFPSDLSIERISFINCKENQFKSVFYHLRNAFAHGRFAIKNVNCERVMVFEDVGIGKYKGKVSARMILKISTLLKWIDIIEAGEKEYKA